MASLVLLPDLLRDIVTIYKLISIVEGLLCITMVLHAASMIISRREIVQLNLSYHTLIGMLDPYTSFLCLLLVCLGCFGLVAV